MGFGIKTDFATGRKLDLNKSYKLLIKPVVESKGLTCIRADEILHSGSIDYQMYKELLSADIVIADLSTANVNAFYELGIRHALRRRTTIVISEDKLAYPFDLNHIKITSYTHLGEAIDYEEVERFRKVLGDTIDNVISADDPDSPVYAYLHELSPPFIKKEHEKPIRKWNVFYRAKPLRVNQPEPVIDQNNPTLSLLVEQGEEALQKREFNDAKALFTSAVQYYHDESNQDPYLIQRLAFATYKAKLPDAVTSLVEAIKILAKLDIDHTNDTETVSLAGRIEKKLHEKGQGDAHLANAIQFYERGYFLLQNRYHGINLAFLLNKRMDSSLYPTREDKIADMIWANRVRRNVLRMCENDLNEIMNRKNRMAAKISPGIEINLSDYNVADDDEQMFWILVNKAESHYALDETDEFRAALSEAKKIPHAPWMFKSFEDQHILLRDLMNKYKDLHNPPWKGCGDEEN